jgi:hypothetical protein
LTTYRITLTLQEKKDYEVTLVFSLPDATSDPEGYVQALAESGCDDALIGIGQRGRVALDFTRSAKSAFKAVGSAVCDVRRAIPEAVLADASPDFVGLTDVADLAGFSRQNMRKLMVGNSTTFPVPVHEGKPAVWHLATVLTWLSEELQRPVDAVLLEVARATMSINIAKEARQLPGTILPKELAQLFA